MTEASSPGARSKSVSPPFDSVLVPTDSSETANLAVPLAYYLVRQGGTVHLLHVCQLPHLGNPMYGPFAVGYVPTPEETVEGRARLQKALEQLPPPAAAERNIHTKIHLVDGVNASRTIEEQAAELGADMVVMGTHGRGGLKRALFGSVATDIMKSKKLSVILVHRDGTLS